MYKQNLNYRTLVQFNDLELLRELTDCEMEVLVGGWGSALVQASSQSGSDGFIYFCLPNPSGSCDLWGDIPTSHDTVRN